VRAYRLRRKAQREAHGATTDEEWISDSEDVSDSEEKDQLLDAKRNLVGVRSAEGFADDFAQSLKH
jgi:hypothetical protein